MPDWLVSILGNTYSKLPPVLRAPAKRVFVWLSLRVQALVQRRRVWRCLRVEFVDFEIADLATRELLGPAPGETLVRAEFSCVSPGTERAVLCGLPGARRAFPYAPGYSVCGRVVENGRGGSAVPPGTLVAGRMSHASLGVMTRESLFAVPAGVGANEAAWIELGIIALQGIRKARIRPGQRVAVVGQGLIGQLAVRLARVAGAGSIVAVAASRRRARSVVGPAAADEFIALNDSPEVLRELGADITIEAVGSSKAIVSAIEATRTGGSVVLLGSSRDLGRSLDWWSIAQRRSITLVGAHIGALPRSDATVGRWTYEQEGQLFLGLLAARRLELAGLVTWCPSPMECNRVYETLAEGGGEHVGILFDWTRLTSGSQADVRLPAQEGR